MAHKNSPNIGNVMGSITSDRLQYLVFIGVSLLVFGFVTTLYFSNSQSFQRFIGRLNPLITFLFVIVLGFVLLSFLLNRQWFAIYEVENVKGLLQSAGLAALLGIIMILVDTKIIFPADTNILYPESLLFYPAIGFLVEIVFHVLPLTVLLFILYQIFMKVNFGNLVWICILIVSIIEPIYHATNMAASNRYPVWAVVYVGVHIFLINFFQLLIFRKYDFISMYSFRLVYYVFWHIVWGHIRLGLLF